jgi:hypothetical protein
MRARREQCGEFEIPASFAAANFGNGAPVEQLPTAM